MSELSEIKVDPDLDLATFRELQNAWRALQGVKQSKKIEGLGAFESMLRVNKILEGYVLSGK